MRFLLLTVLRARGFTVDGLRQYTWPEVTDAVLSDGSLKLSLKYGSGAEHHSAIVADPAFLAGISDWLPVHHPIRRAIVSDNP